MSANLTLDLSNLLFSTKLIIPSLITIFLGKKKRIYNITLANRLDTTKSIGEIKSVKMRVIKTPNI